MIASHPRVTYFAEPFNPEQPGSPFRNYFTYVTEDEAKAFIAHLRYPLESKYPWWRKVRVEPTPKHLLVETIRAARIVIRRWCGHRQLVKDPMMLLSAEWLAHRYQPDIIVLSRHPAAFASSLKRLHWFFPFNDLLSQPRLIQDYLQPFSEEIEKFSVRPPGIIPQAILLWRILHYVILRYRVKHPDWIFVRHEDLSAHPVEEFRRLFGAIGLTFNDQVQLTIQDYTQPGNPREAKAGVVHDLKRNSVGNIWNWIHRLTPAEVCHVRKGTEDIACHFYSDADWTPPFPAMRRGRSNAPEILAA
jgi:hypothetical protein